MVIIFALKMSGNACGVYSWTDEVTFFFFLNWVMLVWNAYLISVGACFVYTYAACAYAFGHGDCHANVQRYALDGVKYGAINYIGTIVGSCTMVGILWLPQVMMTIILVKNSRLNPFRTHLILMEYRQTAA
jgi:hypothetical protein